MTTTITTAMASSAPVSSTAAEPEATELHLDVTLATVTRVFGDQTQALPALEFWAQLGDVVPLDTALLPPGLVSYRQGGGFSQLVIQQDPRIHAVCWGESEGGPHKIYQLAMPYKIMIGCFKGDQLVGGRLFFSPRPVTSLRDPLYHAPLPNINCRGYGGTGVGWVCLYHKNVPCPGVAARARYLVDRISGGEPFNNNNMSETDGPRFYQAMLASAGKDVMAYKFQWNALAWHNHTQKHGVDWTVEDPDLWIPVLVENMDSQEKHVPGGVPLTLGMAMHGHTKFYYHDEPIKLYDQLTRQENAEPDTMIFAGLGTVFGRAAAVPVPYEEPTAVVVADSPWHAVTPAVQGYCPTCGKHGLLDPQEDHKRCVTCVSKEAAKPKKKVVGVAMTSANSENQEEPF